jgi:hypothetical protein
MTDRKDPYGNTWINPPGAPAAPEAPDATLHPDIAAGITPEVMAEAVAAHERSAPPADLVPRAAAYAEHAKNTEASQWGMRWVWLGFDSRDGRLLAGDSAPLTSGAIKFGEVRELWVRPMRPFKGRYLWVHSAAARSFLIHSVRVGNQMAGIGTQPIPADMFAVDYGELAKLTIHDVEPGKLVSIEVHQAPAAMPRGGAGWRGIPFDLPACQVGQDIGIIVENIERTVFEPLRFLGAFLGETPAA